MCPDHRSKRSLDWEQIAEDTWRCELWWRKMRSSESHVIEEDLAVLEYKPRRISILAEIPYTPQWSAEYQPDIHASIIRLRPLVAETKIRLAWILQPKDRHIMKLGVLCRQ
jgi:hypothetical protein